MMVYVLTHKGKRVGEINLSDDYMLTFGNGFDNKDEPFQRKNNGSINTKAPNKKEKIDTDWQPYRTVPEYVEAKKLENDDVVGGNRISAGQWVVKHGDGTITVHSPMQFEREFEKVEE